jgi:aromatic-L-amino-acid/L-tryptophan decarboxylase
MVEAEPDLEVLAPPTLSVVCFRYAPTILRGDEGALNRLNKRLMEALQAGGETFLSGTTLRNRFALRACVLHYDTNEEDLMAIINAVIRTGKRIEGDQDQ